MWVSLCPKDKQLEGRQRTLVLVERCEQKSVYYNNKKEKKNERKKEDNIYIYVERELTSGEGYSGGGENGGKGEKEEGQGI